uniref:Uncharacterized protein n=1 Tax=Plectus sambesii TaxID=2011161 RepID=A0A914VPE5_9BILA
MGLDKRRQNGSGIPRRTLAWVAQECSHLPRRSLDSRAGTDATPLTCTGPRRADRNAHVSLDGRARRQGRNGRISFSPSAATQAGSHRIAHVSLNGHTRQQGTDGCISFDEHWTGSHKQSRWTARQERNEPSSRLRWSNRAGPDRNAHVSLGGRSGRQGRNKQDSFDGHWTGSHRIARVSLDSRAGRRGRTDASLLRRVLETGTDRAQRVAICDGSIYCRRHHPRGYTATRCSTRLVLGFIHYGFSPHL